MNRTISMVATEATVAEVHRGLTNIEHVDSSEIDDWNGLGSGLDAPFNPWRPSARLRTLTAVFDDVAGHAVMHRLLDAQHTAPNEGILLLDPMTGREIGRVGPGATADEVGELLLRAPRLD